MSSRDQHDSNTRGHVTRRYTFSDKEHSDMAQLSSSISPAYGYHRTSLTRISFTHPELLGPIKNCTLYLHFTLPPLIFVDPYELAHYEESYSFRHWGTSNLELPVTAVPQESSFLLLTVKTTKSDTREMEVKLPLHVRLEISPGLRQ